MTKDETLLVFTLGCTNQGSWLGPPMGSSCLTHTGSTLDAALVNPFFKKSIKSIVWNISWTY